MFDPLQDVFRNRSVLGKRDCPTVRRSLDGIALCADVERENRQARRQAFMGRVGKGFRPDRWDQPAGHAIAGCQVRQILNVVIAMDGNMPGQAEIGVDIADECKLDFWVGFDMPGQVDQ